MLDLNICSCVYNIRGVFSSCIHIFKQKPLFIFPGVNPLPHQYNISLALHNPLVKNKIKKNTPYNVAHITLFYQPGLRPFSIASLTLRWCCVETFPFNKLVDIVIRHQRALCHFEKAL